MAVEECGVLIVGAGIAGMGMAFTLHEKGRDDFIVLEQGDDVGGTWYLNSYPGCASDVPAHFYSYSFSKRHDWTRRYASQPEMLAYLKNEASRRDLKRNVRFNAKVVSAVFDEPVGRWLVATACGEMYMATAVVLAVGALHEPSTPDYVGLEQFAGKVFHSSRWERSCNLDGKSVAVVGTGASSVQIVPAIASSAGRLYVFQRTAPWILPRKDRVYRHLTRLIFRKFWFVAVAYRWYLYWRAEIRVLAFKNQKWLLKIAKIRAMRHLRSQIDNEAMRNRLAPSYDIGCKQLLLSNEYYPTFNRSNVELVTSPIEKFSGGLVQTKDGRTRHVDVVILATGFHTLGTLSLIEITGREGIRLREVWAGGPEAFMGMCVAGFPNLFTVVGPNSGLAHTSIFFVIECQVRYIERMLRMIERGGRRVEVDEVVQRKFNTKLQRVLARTVWIAGNCDSWYLDETGKNRILWPYSTLSYWMRTRRVSGRTFLPKSNGIQS